MLMHEVSMMGTTSACAENTPCGTNGRNGGGNYLRVRGEYHPPEASATNASELPPRARRILVSNRISFRLFGTTSACAENTRHVSPAQQRFWNYLRVRGEYRSCQYPKGQASELPPRARRIRETNFPR